MPRSGRPKRHSAKKQLRDLYKVNLWAVIDHWIAMVVLQMGLLSSTLKRRGRQCKLPRDSPTVVTNNSAAVRRSKTI